MQEQPNPNYAESLKYSFDKFYPAPIEVWQEFAEKCEPIAFKKDEIIKRENSLERYFYFILNGSAGIFLWKENNFVCLDFAFENSFCGDYMSILTKKPTPLQVIALEQSQMLRISTDQLTELASKSIGQVIMRISAEGSFIDKQQQQIELLTKDSKSRYKILLEKYPNIHQQVAQKHITSYLGITPQSLSRIRREKF